MKKLCCDVFILGAGAGGFGACYRLAQSKVKTVIADVHEGYGGTAVFSGVSCFEPGVSLDGVHRIIAEKLLQNGSGEVQRSIPSRLTFCEKKDIGEFNEPLVSGGYLWGLSVPCQDDYESTLKRCKSLCPTNKSWRRFMMDEDALTKTMSELMEEYADYVTPLFKTRYVSCKTDGRKIKSVILENEAEQIEVVADYFIDASGSIVLLRDAGCQYEVGYEGDISKVNGVSVVLRVSKDKCPPLQIPYDEDISAWKQEKLSRVVSCFNMYPNGDININMLPTLTGKEYLELGERAYAVGVCRAVAYWEHLQTLHPELKEYSIKKIFAAGIREDYRLLGKKVLKTEDIMQGVKPDEPYVAISDHALDSHGIEGMPCGEMQVPYGIPLSCAQAKEFDNAFAACRGASFSSTVASSARLTRTMMSMGEGIARYIAKELQK